MDAAGVVSMNGTGAVHAVETVDGHEREIALDLVRHAALLTPLALLVGGLLAGWQGALGVLLGMIVVAGNFLLLAKLIAGTGRLGGSGAAAGAMLGYLTLLVVVTVLAVIVREVPAIDLAAFVLTVGIAHLVLLAWEVPRVGLTLGAPGLKPRPLSRRKLKEQG